jgi:hypothetical protein
MTTLTLAAMMFMPMVSRNRRKRGVDTLDEEAMEVDTDEV